MKSGELGRSIQRGKRWILIPRLRARKAERSRSWSPRPAVLPELVLSRRRVPFHPSVQLKQLGQTEALLDRHLVAGAAAPVACAIDHRARRTARRV